MLMLKHNLKTLEIMFEHKHVSNLVSLIAPVNKSQSLFKWDNRFSWAYNGNITDSMKENVKKHGGKVDGVLRFSIQWNDNDDNHDDLDAHCYGPDNMRITYMNKKHHSSKGQLDVDIQNPNGVAVENITWGDLDKMPEGEYTFAVHCYRSTSRTKSGFTAEIEFDGQIHSFAYNKSLRQSEYIDVASVTYKKGQGFKLKELLKSSLSSNQVWDINTNQFHPVTVSMYSPNYWDEQQGIGHKHYFFMLDGCKNSDSPNGFFNEFLKEDFDKHKRVFEALGSKMSVQDSEDQLSGLGFSSTKRNSIICKVGGTFDRVLKVLI